MNLPTKLTVLRIVLIPVFVALYFVKFPFNGIAAVAVFMIACFTDFLDGHLARKWNQVTTLENFWILLRTNSWLCAPWFALL